MEKVIAILPGGNESCDDGQDWPTECGIGIFIYMIVSDRISTKAESNRVCELSQYIVTASGLVHELQKEL